MLVRIGHAPDDGARIDIEIEADTYTYNPDILTDLQRRSYDLYRQVMAATYITVEASE